MKFPITEAEWLAAPSLYPYCTAVENKRNARKMRLFGCACCRRLGGLLTDPRSLAALDAAERYADSEVKRAAVPAVRAAAHAAVTDLPRPSIGGGRTGGRPARPS
jgi:hypothetical protein